MTNIAYKYDEVYNQVQDLYSTVKNGLATKSDIENIRHEVSRKFVDLVRYLFNNFNHTGPYTEQDYIEVHKHIYEEYSIEDIRNMIKNIKSVDEKLYPLVVMKYLIDRRNQNNNEFFNFHYYTFFTLHNNNYDIIIKQLDNYLDALARPVVYR